MPPSKISRAIAKEVLVISCVSLLVLTVLIMFIGVAREAVRQGIGIGSVLRLIPYAVPNALAISLPGSVLFSVCCAFGRMSAANEIVALQSVGISPFAVMRPAIVIAFVLSLVAVGLINLAFTWGHHGIQGVVLSSIEQVAYGVLQRDRSFQHGPMSLTVMDVDGRRLVRPVITVRQAGGKPISIEAEEAEMTYAAESNGLTLSLTNGTATLGNRASFRFPDTFVHTVPLQVTPDYDLLSANPSHMPMSDLSPAAIEQTLDIHRREDAITVHTGFNLLTSRFDSIAGNEAEQRLARLHQSRRRLHRLNTEMHRRWASGFTCLALAMVGIPFAIRMKTSDAMTTFGLCFLPTVLVYYPLFALTLDMAKQGKIPPSAVWGANYVFFSISVVMMRRTLYS